MGSIITWQTPVTDLKGVSAKRATLLTKLGIKTCGELVNHWPRYHEDWATLTTGSDLDWGAEVTLLARCESVGAVQRKGKMTILRAVFADAKNSKIAAVWFNQPYIKESLTVGDVYLLHGVVSTKPPLQLHNPAFTLQPYLSKFPLEDIKPQALVKTFIKPVYASTAGLTQGVLRSLIKQSLQALQGEIAKREFLLPNICKQYDLVDYKYALNNIHFPPSLVEYNLAKKRLVFEELFFMQLGLRFIRKRRLLDIKTPTIKLNAQQQAKFAQCVKNLPFQLTVDQAQAVKDIVKDLESGLPMDRLLQGDVGSGKTIVAILALYYCFLGGYQGILMAPTAILAEQHWQNLSKYLADEGVKVALLTGKTKASTKRQILADFAGRQLDIIIGTQAVLNENLQMARPGLVITDEQHRFGVNQRLSMIKEQDKIAPHVLVMSATPIPRSLALVLYGDLSLSLIKQLPPGRLPIKTYTVLTVDLARAYSFVQKIIAGGQQVYVICPLKVDTGLSDKHAAEDLFAQWQNEIFPTYKLGLLHGGMKEKDKQAVMTSFQRREIDILVSTTVVEVGVDNPNATLLLVMNAENFGLAQLHQLRGRVGRSNLQSYCLLHSDAKPYSPARQRLTTLCKSNDGYELAEQDLQLRGFGDFFGIRQHGLPEFKIANLYEDADILWQAQQAVESLLQEDLKLTWPKHQIYRQALLENLGDIVQGGGI